MDGHRRPRMGFFVPKHSRKEFLHILARCTAGRRAVGEQDRELMGSNALGLGERGHWADEW